MTDILWELYPKFLDYGYAPSLFWESSFGEVVDILESSRRRREAEDERELERIKTEAILNQIQARQIVEFISLSLPGNESKPTPLSKYFPTLFENNEEEENNTELELNKARMKEYAFWHNRRRKEGKE